VRRRYCLAVITELGERVAKKYEARIAIFRILLAINRFSRISWKVEAIEENWKAVGESGKPLKKVRKPLKKAESR
jgi:hypothetical protein